MNTKLRQEK